MTACVQVWKRNHDLSCMASLAKSKDRNLKYVVKSCQKQNNSWGCGVFAIVFATCIAFGSDPNIIIYDRRSLRSHQRDFLEKEAFTPFPSSSGRSTRGSNSSQAEEEEVHFERLYCLCLRTQHRLKSADWDIIGQMRQMQGVVPLNVHYKLPRWHCKWHSLLLSQLHRKCID